jgi:GNAT superfamily N-acetyltransferase
MRHTYSDIPTHTVIHTMEMLDGRIITSVGTRTRGQGNASRLFKTVIEEADSEGVTLYLSVEPDGTGLDEDQLRSWYGRNGFENMDPELSETGMIRQPRLS